MISSFLFVSMLLNFTADVNVFRNDSVDILKCYVNPQNNGNVFTYEIGTKNFVLTLDCDTLFKDGFE